MPHDPFAAQFAQSEKLAALGEMACGIAHDINNILQAVIIGAEIIRQRPNDAQHVEKTSKLLSLAATRGASIVRRVLTLARPSERCAQAVDTSILLAELSDLLVLSLGDGVKLRMHFGADLPRVCVDRAEFETVLINLAINGRDAMNQGGALTVSVYSQSVDDTQVGLPPGDYLRVDVVDSGSGMDKDTLSRAMEPFFSTKPAGKGTGLGLSMARDFAERFGGALRISSAPGFGTSVTLRLPTAPCA
ncbi:signal transduction histidine kinase [Rhodoblastus acidophilus]|uniref:sensor histidine kinase n=1 Tax=Rhodoblastus acidophilus TaxID=1074 RepID=UPI0022256FC4|nr:ATP-binding protein [Rhodoblastus acidophilus]MCW2286405.1 signal transduction histidine kinase [Rhodoblastus acidophilus]MCW2335254.1 signal transduction histidine kinase [Rhodoblastus acidophilus]